MIDYRVYLVTDDPSRYRGNWLDNVRAAVEGGVTCVQYRDTENTRQLQYERILQLRDALASFKTPIIVNNDAELAAAVNAEGVHVGQGDLPPKAVRAIVGPDCEIGRSITSLEDLQQDLPLIEDGTIDCLGVGPIFDARKTKVDASAAMGTDGLKRIVDFLQRQECRCPWRRDIPVASLSRCPVIAIGGITLENAADVVAAGAQGLAIVSAFSKSSDPCAAARAFRKIIETPAISPCCLTIAGSDSGGNAGVQADLRAFHAYGLHGCTVFAALTAQNPFGVSAIHPVPVDFIRAQLDAVLGVYAIRALKTGMLADAAIIEAVAERLARHPEIAKVIDPVMVATSGARLIADSAIATLKERLLPLATLITPNLPETEVLVGHAITSRADVREAARRLHGEFGCAVLVKGGHVVGDLTAAEDTLFDGRDFSSYTMPWIDHPVSTHGTGCSLAAALAAELTLGRPLPEAVAGAKQYVHDAIARSFWVGDNCSVLGFDCRRSRDECKSTVTDDAN